VQEVRGIAEGAELPFETMFEQNDGNAVIAFLKSIRHASAHIRSSACPPARQT